MADFIRETVDVYDYLKGCGKPVVIYGMGNGADKVFDIFQRKGIEVSGVFASDDFVRGHSFRGFRVKTYSQMKEELGDVVVVPAFATRLPEIMERMDFIDGDTEIRFPELPVIGGEPMDMEYIRANMEKIERVYDMLEDDLSRKVFSGLINFRISGKLSYLRDIMTEREEIFSVMGVTDGEVFADMGAYDGDTLRELEDIAGGFKHAIAIEPDRRNFRKLSAFAEDRENITLVNKAVSSGPALLRFNDKAGRNSAFDESGRAEVMADSPDNIFADTRDDVTYVKMDVEGAEADALMGMANTMRARRPKLCICAYHKRGDLWDLPLLINSLEPHYAIYIRKHLYYPGWETAVYCVEKKENNA